jgi:hypothetical protein
MMMGWDEDRLHAVALEAAPCPDACSQDVISLVAEVRRLNARVEMFAFNLNQARIVLDHFRTTLPDPDHRRIAEGAMIASAPPEG